MTTALAIIAIVLSVGALTVAIWNARSDNRSADAAEDSAISARQSADSAKASSESANRVAIAEVERDHRANEPRTNGAFEYQTSKQRGRLLVYQFKLDQTYELKAMVSRDNGTATSARVVTGPGLNEEFRVEVDVWPEKADKLQWDQLTISFWPPADVPGRAKPWTCGCLREGTPGEGLGHWDWVLPVESPRAPRVRWS